jgi:hypothetical protein
MTDPEETYWRFCRKPLAAVPNAVVVFGGFVRRSKTRTRSRGLNEPNAPQADAFVSACKDELTRKFIVAEILCKADTPLPASPSPAT